MCAMCPRADMSWLTEWVFAHLLSTATVGLKLRFVEQLDRYGVQSAIILQYTGASVLSISLTYQLYTDAGTECTK